MFGVGPAHDRVTLNELFVHHHWPVVDFITGLAYFSYIYAVLGFAVFVALVDRTSAGARRTRALGWTFFGVNMAASLTYLLFPVAPPWYAASHGFGPVDPATPASPAALIRWDDSVGVPYFHHFYARASDIFGSMPSMHCAYPMIAFSLRAGAPPVALHRSARRLSALDVLLRHLLAAPLRLRRHRRNALRPLRVLRRTSAQRPRRGPCHDVSSAGARISAASRQVSSPSIAVSPNERIPAFEDNNSDA